MSLTNLFKAFLIGKEEGKNGRGERIARKRLVQLSYYPTFLTQEGQASEPRCWGSEDKGDELQTGIATSCS